MCPTSLLLSSYSTVILRNLFNAVPVPNGLKDTRSGQVVLDALEKGPATVALEELSRESREGFICEDVPNVKGQKFLTERRVMTLKLVLNHL